MRWAWTGFRFGKRVPLAQVTVTHVLSMDDVSQLLCVWAVTESDIWLSLMEGEALSLPDLKAFKINRIVKDAMEAGGTGTLESYWNDDINERQSNLLTTWSIEQCRAAWPERCVESWGVEK